MNNKIIGIAIVGIVFFAVPAVAQLSGDLNCNGFIDVEDIVHAINLVNICEISHSECSWRNGDIDGDGRSMTIGDLLFMPFLILPGPLPPDYSRHPDLDTIMVESAIANPGETIALPLWVKTVDTLVAFQFLLEVDQDYLEFDTVIIYNDFPLVQRNCDVNIYCNAIGDFPLATILLLPGNHHIADIILNVNPDINQPDTTGLYFSSVPLQALYSGFANSDFFLPVMIDAEIQILPLTGVESEEEIIPSEFEISVYPNPFNNALNISMFSDHPTEISVYDIMGRPVKTFAINAGNSLVKWDAADDKGRFVSAGIYFIGVNESSSFKKVLYLK
ncbi:MAG: T9SS type A sorting domain-containing protein [Candidatus Zixiibacteriota bacterium]|nr:MAG: T9SS type A sorting domain-containing protein [candidate division Zixibacteria bacterium]